MPGHEDFTSLEALPPFVGDSAVAAVLLRDVAASLHAPYGGVSAKAIEVGDSGRFQLRPRRVNGSPVGADRAALAAPELFDGATPDDRSDVYAAACLVLTGYLGSSPVPSVALALRAPAQVRLAAVRQAQRTVAPRLGALPDPFRGVFARAMAKQPHLRPTAAQLTALLDAAFAAAGESAEADARARVRRLIALGRAFVPRGDAPAAPVLVPIESEPERSFIALRSMPAFGRPQGFARAALIAAVAIVATGGVAVAAVVGVGAGPNRTPQADATSVATPSSTPSSTPVVATSSAAPTSAAPSTSAAAPTVAPPAPGALAAGNGGGSDNGGSGSYSGSGGSGYNGSGGSGSGGSGSGSGSGGSGGGSGSGGGGSSTPPSSAPPTHSTPPPTHSTPPSSTPPSSTPPSSTPTDPVPTLPIDPTTTPPTSPSASTESTPTTSADSTPTASLESTPSS